MNQYPMAFYAESKADADTSRIWQVRASQFEAECAIPPEFNGPGGALSPEDYFLLALTNCFVATFKVFAKASKISFDEIKTDAKLILNKVSANQIAATDCEITVQINAADNVERALTLLKKTARSGFLLNSVKTELHFRFLLDGKELT